MNSKLFTAVLAAVCFISGSVCASQADTNTHQTASPAAQAVQTAQDAPSAQNNVPSARENTAVPEQIEGCIFEFSSGAGRWFTKIAMHKDGRFDGVYSHGDLSDTGPDYPKGTIRRCEFSGTFDGTGRDDDYTFRFKITSLKVRSPKAGEYAENGIRYLAADPYGVPPQGEECVMYLPGKPMSEVPKLCQEAGRFILEANKTDELPFFCFWNGRTGSIFFASQSGTVYSEEHSGETEFCSGRFQAVSPVSGPEGYRNNDIIYAGRPSSKFFSLIGTPFKDGERRGVILKNEDGVMTEGGKLVMILHNPAAPDGGTIKWVRDSRTGEETIYCEYGGPGMQFKRIK